MALSLVVSLIPRIKDEVIISFATSALVTGIALIATGFTQAQREEIAYYQQALIVQMAGMGFGPAAMAWLKRGHGRPDTVFFTFTIVYVVVMGCYMFYIVGQESTTGPVINCFLDQVPEIYGKRTMKIVNGVVVGVSVIVILLSMFVNWHINKKYHHGSNDYTRRPSINKFGVALMVLGVFAAETVLAISVEKTITEYSQFVSADTRAASQAWQFGQIIPFMMLLQPVMEALRAVVPKVPFPIRSRHAAEPRRESGEESETQEKERQEDTSLAKAGTGDDSQVITRELV
jgi:hypothetical protein